ncbi:MAG: hypothetical protein ABGX25_02640 [Nautiliaceae bacterium]
MMSDEFKNVIDSKKGDFIVNVANEKAKNLKSYNLTTNNPFAEMSDNKNFWNLGYNTIMIRDTAFSKNPNYYTPNDTAFIS